MIYQRKKMVKTIMNTDPALFDRDFNQFMQNVLDRGCEYEVHYVDGLGKLCCQIFYESVIEIPESLVEDHMLCEDSKHCSDCPLFWQMRAADPRGQKKYFRCEYGEGRAYAEREACEWFYKKNDNERSDEDEREGA